MMKRFCMLTGIVLACATAAFAEDAEKTAPDRQGLFDTLDSNGDGKLVADEIPEGKKRFFERLIRVGDEDGDGELSRSEFTQTASKSAGVPAASRLPFGAGPGRRRPGSPADFFKRLDRNEDGKVERSELPERLAGRMGRLFDRLDKEAITLEDLEKFHRTKGARGPEGRPDKRPGMRRPGGPAGRRGPGGPGGRRGPGPHPRFMQLLDSDGNGRLNREELEKAPSLLDELDHNDDGALDLGELAGPPPHGGQGRTNRPPRRPDFRPGPPRRRSGGDTRRPGPPPSGTDGEARRPGRGPR